MQTPTSRSRRVIDWFSQPAIFRAIIVLLIVQAAWIALSGRYPMAFDEDFHLGIIRLYAHHLSPFWSGQPAGANVYGAVARDPSYLYQYLMSFPYRLISAMTANQTAQVLVLRGVNIALLASSLPLYRRLFRKTGASVAVVHLSLLIFVLIPVVPLLAAQINYDNLFIPLTGLSLLLTVRIVEELRQYQRLHTPRLMVLLIVCLLTSLVKYAFLPIFMILLAYILFHCWRAFPSRRKFLYSLGFGATLIGRRARWLLLICLVLAGGLFIERYGINTLRYHTPIPACDKVLSTQQCSAYGPWIRDYNFAINKVDEAHNPLVYSGDWLQGMWLRLFFAVDGPATQFQTRGPLAVPAIGAIVVTVSGAALLLVYGRRIIRHYNPRVITLFIIASFGYIGLLFIDEYQAYAQTGQPVAINGRYLLPVLPLLLLLACLAFQQLLGRKRPGFKTAAAGAAVLIMVWGGGALTYILRSNPSWYWQNAAVRRANFVVQESVGPLVPGYRTPTQFLH